MRLLLSRGGAPLKRHIFNLVTRSKAVFLVKLFTEKPFIHRLYTKTLHGRSENTSEFFRGFVNFHVLVGS